MTLREHFFSISVSKRFCMYEVPRTVSHVWVSRRTNEFGFYLLMLKLQPLFIYIIML
jgi:hypothetical protein